MEASGFWSSAISYYTRTHALSGSMTWSAQGILETEGGICEVLCTIRDDNFQSNSFENRFMGTCSAEENG